MASMLVQVKLLSEAELLLSTFGSGGISLDCHEIFKSLIEGYVDLGELERAISVYDQMRNRGMFPSRSCYCVLLDLLVQMKRIQPAFRISLDIVELGVPLSGGEKYALENVVRILCRYGKIQEARSLVKKVLPLNSEVSNLVLDEIVIGYCEKKDFEDLLSFFVEVKRAPTVMAANRVINSLCSCYGVDRAGMFMQELENIGFIPDEITYGILIGWNCREGKLKTAMSYLSVMLSKDCEPLIYTYNALISGLLKIGMSKHARNILDEMIDRGMMPDISTFRVLIAGYCKARRFDEVKMLINEMASRGLIEISILEDPLSKAFLIIGLNPLAVRLKRDNDVRLSNTEFFDDIGNGLYLDTDLDEYENHITWVLEDSMVPNFNSSIRKESIDNNLKTALVFVEEMLLWGQELLLPNLSELVRQLCSSRSQIKEVSKLLEKMPWLAHKLDEETLSLVVQAYSRKGLLHNAKAILDEMLQRQLCIKNEAYTALLMSLWKKGKMRDVRNYWDIALSNKWLPSLESFKHLLHSICHRKMLKEAFQFLEIMLLSYPYSRFDICRIFLDVLSDTGFTGATLVFLEQLNHSLVLDHTDYNNLIRGFCNEGKLSEALIILDGMLDKNSVPSLEVSVLLIDKLFKAGIYDKAIAFKDIILKERPQLSPAAYRTLICGFCNLGKVEQADTLFKDMLSKGLMIPDAELCNILIQGHCKANNFRKVGELLGVAIRKSLDVSISSYRNLVQAMCTKGGVLFALSLKNLMLARSTFDGLVFYNILIFYLFSCGKSYLVNKTLEEMEEKNVVLNEVTYNFLVNGFMQCKDLSSSVHYMTTMIGKELRPSNRNMRRVISSLCSIGELQKALELSQAMELRGWIHGSTIQNSITEALLSRGKLQEAENILNRLAERSLIPDSINYDHLIKCFCRYGRLNKAVHLMNMMLKKQNVPSSTSYDSLICGFCSQNELDRAWDFYSEVSCRSLKPKINTLEMLVHSFCQHGRTGQAEQFLVDMIEEGETPTRKMFVSVINNYRMENNLRKASKLMKAMQQHDYKPDFETQWSLISNLSSVKGKETDNSSKGFLAELLSRSGFGRKK
ncbi:hypothetical protein L6164_006791 [Bauhinia variegata]|nr:hypothetical protein L6164_006791 [Bauhinia variegata]